MKLDFPTGLEHLEKPIQELGLRIAETEAKGKALFPDPESKEASRVAMARISSIDIPARFIEDTKEMFLIALQNKGLEIDTISQQMIAINQAVDTAFEIFSQPDLGQKIGRIGEINEDSVRNFIKPFASKAIESINQKRLEPIKDNDRNSDIIIGLIATAMTIAETMLKFDQIFKNKPVKFEEVYKKVTESR